MDVAHGFRPKSHNHRNKNKGVNGDCIGSNSNNPLVIKLPHFRVLSIVARSLFLGVIVIAFPLFESMVRGPSANVSNFGSGSDSFDLELWDLISHDLADEGLIKKGHKGLVISSTFKNLNPNFKFLTESQIEMLILSDLEFKSSIPDKTFDFAITSRLEALMFVDHVMRIGSIVAFQIDDNSLNGFGEPLNYRIVYLRRFNSTIVAMRKIKMDREKSSSHIKHRLCGLVSVAKRAALQGLESPLLEPPRPAFTLTSSNKYLEETKFLPNLMGDSLESYRRRVFIDFGLEEKSKETLNWFIENYPTRNQVFELYNFAMVMDETLESSQTRVSVWLMNNVAEEDYVVMKAEADLVEKLIKEKDLGVGGRSTTYYVQASSISCYKSPSARHWLHRLHHTQNQLLLSAHFSSFFPCLQTQQKIMAKFNCFILALSIALSFSSLDQGLAARRLLDTAPTAAPSLPTIPALPKQTLPPLPAIPTLPTLPTTQPTLPTPTTLPPLPSLPTVPTLPTIPTTQPTLPNPTTLPPLPSIPTVPTIPTMPKTPTIPPFPTIPTMPTIPFLSPPPSTTTSP
ncbi:hypothetical protein RJ641_000202 [Dillenia turbinata]|uniref:DUF7870 domain-containing protein n=1 Tax=Dillenia turbinata TaxID=194707 RepID=A0AAN8WBI3_9MAGN